MTDAAALFDANPQFWTDLTNSTNPFVPAFESSIPGNGVSFQDYRVADPAVPDTASLGNFDARWAWITNSDPATPPSMLDAWMQWDQMNGDIDILKLLDDEYLP